MGRQRLFQVLEVDSNQVPGILLRVFGRVSRCALGQHHGRARSLELLTMEDQDVVQVLQVALAKLNVESRLGGGEVDGVEGEVLLRGKRRDVRVSLEEPEEGPARV